MDGDGDSRQKIAENRPVRLKPQFFQSKARRTAEQNDQHHSMIVTTALLRKYRSKSAFFIALI